jgi:hypothetical protein
MSGQVCVDSKNREALHLLTQPRIRFRWILPDTPHSLNIDRVLFFTYPVDYPIVSEYQFTQIRHDKEETYGI